jgi:hypothetical protein
LAAGTARAEVGVVHDGSSTPAGPYEIQAIIEDGDPVGAAWRPYSTSGGGRFILNAEGEANEDGRPSSLFSIVSGLPMVAWARNSAGGYDVVISHFAAGAWSQPTVLAEDATVSEAADPHIAVNPADGSVYVLYWTNDASPTVMYRKAPADLSSWSTPVQVSNPGDVAVRPTGVFHQGVLHVAYENHTSQLGGTPRQIVHAWEDDSSFISEVISVTGHEGSNRPEVHSSGAVIWIDWLDSEGEMTWTRKEGSGGWDPVEIEPFTTTEERDFHVRETIETHALGM